MNLVLAIVIFAGLAGLLALFAGALIGVLGSRLSGGMKLVWLVLVFMAPFLGAVLWFLIGRKQAVSTAVGRYGT